jgi:hypothetical protein
MAATIKVPFPHMALNSHNVPPPDYLMFNTWKVAASTTVSHMIGWTAKVARGGPGGKLATLIFNSHGRPGNIDIGVGIGSSDAGAFAGLNGLVKRIWFVSCEVAGDYSQVASGAPDGKDFCKEVARASGAYVTAGSAIQKAGKMSLAVGYIDEWEGDLFIFDSDGNPTTRYVQPQ